MVIDGRSALPLATAGTQEFVLKKKKKNAEDLCIRMVKKNKIKKSVTLDGLMTLGQLEDGRHTADFACCEDVELEQVKGTFSVDIQRDGNVYMTEEKKRIRNTPLFREDNSSFSHGRNKRYYYVFSMEDDRIEDLAEELVRQANVIAQKISRELLG